MSKRNWLILCLILAAVPLACNLPGSSGSGRDPLVDSQATQLVRQATTTAEALSTRLVLTEEAAGPGQDPIERPTETSPTPQRAGPTGTPEAGEEAETNLQSQAEVVYTPDGDPCIRPGPLPQTTAGSGQPALRNAGSSEATLLKLTGYDSPVLLAEFSPDGSRILTSGNDARLWDATSGILARRLAGESGLYSAVMSPDGQLVAARAGDSTIRLIAAADGAERLSIMPPLRSYIRRSLVFSPDSRLLASAEGYAARLWLVESGEELRAFEGQVVEEGQDIFNPDKVANGHAQSILDLSFSPNGQALLTAGADGTVRLWEVASGRHLRCFEDESSGVFDFRSAAFSPDGRQVVGLRDHDFYVWDALSGRILFHFDRGAGLIDNRDFTSARFTPDGQAILTSSADQTARIWDLASGRFLTLLRHPDGVNWAAFSPDGRRIVTAIGQSALYTTPAYESWVWDAGHPDLKLAAEAQNTLEDGIQLALDGRLDEGLAAFQEAQALNPFSDYDLEGEGLDRLANALVDDGVERAMAGDLSGARNSLRQAQAVNPNPSRDLLDIGNSRVFYALVSQAQSQARAGEVGPALAALAGARQFDPEQPLSAGVWDTICRYGSLWSQPAAVEQACDTAVAEATYRGSLAEHRDSRGINRALGGDFAGAVEDFAFYIDIFAGDEFRQPAVDLRRFWIAELRAGRNPFDEATLAGLRDG